MPRLHFTSMFGVGRSTFVFHSEMRTPNAERRTSK
jgi:hypothetical protein